MAVSGATQDVIFKPLAWFVEKVYSTAVWRVVLTSAGKILTTRKKRPRAVYNKYNYRFHFLDHAFLDTEHLGFRVQHHFLCYVGVDSRSVSRT